MVSQMFGHEVIPTIEPTKTGSGASPLRLSDSSVRYDDHGRFAEIAYQAVLLGIAMDVTDHATK